VAAMPVAHPAIPCDAGVPKKPASPKVNIPASPATIQYPLPDGEAAIPTTGAFSFTAPIEP
jgi:hypothetical protein